MFFLGLLSTPLPYLLLAAFYFFGFAMGMFNNNSGEETIDAVASVTIPAETKPKVAESSFYYFHTSNHEVVQCNYKTADHNSGTLFYPPDQQRKGWPVSTLIQYNFRLSGFLFSRPPPSLC